MENFVLIVGNILYFAAVIVIVRFGLEAFFLLIAPVKEELPKQVILDMLRYCEDQQIYDKLGKYGDFYYKAKKWVDKK